MRKKNYFFLYWLEARKITNCWKKKKEEPKNLKTQQRKKKKKNQKTRTLEKFISGPFGIFGVKNINFIFQQYVIFHSFCKEQNWPINSCFLYHVISFQYVNSHIDSHTRKELTIYTPTPVHMYKWIRIFFVVVNQSQSHKLST